MHTRGGQLLPLGTTHYSLIIELNRTDFPVGGPNRSERFRTKSNTIKSWHDADISVMAAMDTTCNGGFCLNVAWRPSVRRGLCMKTSAEVLLPITFGRGPDQRFARWIDLHLEEFVTNLELRAKRIPVCIQFTGTMGRVWTLRLLLSLWLCCGEGFGPLFAKGCNRNAALTTCKQNLLLQLSATVI